MSFVPGEAMSNDQTSLPFSSSSSPSFTLPLGTFARAVYLASVLVILALASSLDLAFSSALAVYVAVPTSRPIAINKQRSVFVFMYYWLVGVFPPQLVPS